MSHLKALPTLIKHVFEMMDFIQTHFVSYMLQGEPYTHQYKFHNYRHHLIFVMDEVFLVNMLHVHQFGKLFQVLIPYSFKFFPISTYFDEIPVYILMSTHGDKLLI